MLSLVVNSWPQREQFGHLVPKGNLTKVNCKSAMPAKWGQRFVDEVDHIYTDIWIFLYFKIDHLSETSEFWLEPVTNVFKNSLY